VPQHLVSGKCRLTRNGGDYELERPEVIPRAEPMKAYPLLVKPPIVTLGAKSRIPVLLDHLMRVKSPLSRRASTRSVNRWASMSDNRSEESMVRATYLGVIAVAAAISGAATAAPAAADAGADNDSAYFAFLHDHGVSADAPATMKQTALGICRGFDDGLTFIQVDAPLIDGGATAHQAAVEIIGAVDAHCPRNDRALSFANPATRLVDFSMSNGHQAHWLPVWNAT
jgi:hypothetical protein